MSAIDPPEKKRRGCFFYGCITLLVFVFVAAVGAFFVIRYVANIANAKIAEYTETQPMIFPKTDLPADELGNLKARVDAFNAAMDAHSNAPPLVLTGPEINALLANNPDFKQFKNECYVEIAGDQIKGEISLPIEKYFRVPFVHTKGRYLNGTGTLKVGVTNQRLSVYVQSLEVNGKALPPKFMAQIQGKDMAADVKNPTNTAPTSRYDVCG